jgi:hypothetical protein
MFLCGPLLTSLYHRHDGLTRSTSDLTYICMPGEESCSEKTPKLIRYDGYKNMHEPVSDIVPCLGPRGLLMNESDEDAVWAYSGTAQGNLFLVLPSHYTQ